MNIIWILKKELLQLYRNPKEVIQLTLFPIILIMVLGFSLTGAFYNPEDFSRVNILYYVRDSGFLTEEFKSFIIQMEKRGFEFDVAKDMEDAYKSIQNNKYSCIVIINNKSSELELYRNEKDTIKADIAEALLSSFIQRFNITYHIMKESPGLDYQTLESEDSSYVKEIEAEGKKQPKSIDYYAITMITLFVLYSSLGGVKSIRNEQFGHTKIRLACSVVKNYEILVGKILGIFIFYMLQITFLIMFSKYVLKAYWGHNIGIILILVASEILAALSLGIGLDYLYGKETSITAYLNKLLPIMAFLGGCYLPIDSFNDKLNAVSYLSPIKWVNKAIFQVIYSNDTGMAIFTFVIYIIIASTFIGISFILSKKEVA